MVSHQYTKFGGNQHYVSGDVTLLVAEEGNSRCFCFNSPHRLSLNDMV